MATNAPILKLRISFSSQSCAALPRREAVDMQHNGNLEVFRHISLPTRKLNVHGHVTAPWNAARDREEMGV
jgi:hypothetical protein